MSSGEVWYRIEMPYRKSIVFAVAVGTSGVVESAADVAAWTRGKPWETVREWYKAKGAYILALPAG